MAKEPFAAKLTSIWIGGFFFWMLTGFKGNISNQYVKKFENRNLWIGYLIILIVIVVGYIYVFKK